MIFFIVISNDNKWVVISIFLLVFLLYVYLMVVNLKSGIVREFFGNIGLCNLLGFFILNDKYMFV